MGLSQRWSAVLGLAVCATAVTAGSFVRAPARVSAETAAEPIAPIPSAPSLNPGRVKLGRRLFADRRLSGENARACTTCHPLDRGGMDGLRQVSASKRNALLRNTPTVFNAAFETLLNWDGSAETLERHAEMVLLNPDLMNTTWPELLRKLRSDPGYLAAFARAYPDGLSQRTVLDALATFERSLQTPGSRFDRYLRGESDALTAGERRGYELFKSYGCGACHHGVNVGGTMLQRFGIVAEPPSPPGSDGDQGRFQVTRAPADRGVFRVPSLRNVAVTAPYFHDGRAATLEAAVDTMAKVQLGRTLTGEEIGLIVQFLRTLTGRYDGAPLRPPGPRAPGDHSM